MKRTIAICITAILIVVIHESADLLKVQSQIEWGARLQIARELHQEQLRRGPKVEVPTDKAQKQSLEKL